MEHKCLIVEDELPAQRILKKFIADVPHLTLTGCSSNALEAMEVLNTNHIDLLFLDIHLPKLKGIDFLKSIKNPPKVIFTTAYAEYAVDGFELDAVDYLLKPFSFQRFLKAVNKASESISSGTNIAKPYSNTNLEEDTFFFKADKKIHRVDLRKLLYIEGVKDYIKIVMEDDSFLVLQTMKHWAEALPSKRFKRIHKSYIVNLKRINSINGNTLIIGDRELPIGRNFKEELLLEIENNYLI